MHFITSWCSIKVLQSRTSVIKKWGRFFLVTKRDNLFYKEGQVLKNGSTFIRKWAGIRKRGIGLQSGAIIKIFHIMLS